ncbi:prenylated rab acceptor PRA1 [Myriangium duriaei CBS 260.36]|uniref:PRA1 family protein n=1 Tax=Myriangium duriaei CBS 260.36 TaxID=1168546 RepID=A0A9P4JE61_9PEZI|nr:prenylated rab acceptor PRA1 [Myriangium duriaei CBS 260.36]
MATLLDHPVATECPPFSFDALGAQSLTTHFSSLKPFSDFFDIKRMSRPSSLLEAQGRLNYNLSYFSSNYAIVFIILSIYSLLTNILLFFDILLVIGGIWGIGKLKGRDLDLGFARVSVSQLYTVLICITLPLGFRANPFSAAIWLIGASSVCILGHAAFMEKPIESHFSEEV